MALVRTPLDTLLAFNKGNPTFFNDLGKELFLDTNMIIDVPGVPSGKQ